MKELLTDKFAAVEEVNCDPFYIPCNTTADCPSLEDCPNSGVLKCSTFYEKVQINGTENAGYCRDGSVEEDISAN